MKAFLSIVCPTKDRPECVRILLNSLKNQTNLDFKIIISDNPNQITCKSVIENFLNYDIDIRYIVLEYIKSYAMVFRQKYRM